MQQECEFFLCPYTLARHSQHSGGHEEAGPRLRADLVHGDVTAEPRVEAVRRVLAQREVLTHYCVH